jgi:MATE family multidrug resistance protein
VAASWARWSILGALPFYLFVALRQSLQAMASVRPVVTAIVVGNFVNVAFNWLLIYGNAGFPALGAIGSAISTVIGRWVMLGVIVWSGRALLVPALRPWLPESFRLRPILRMVAIGAPVAFQQWLEIGVFSGGAVVLGWFGATALAAHEIALNLAAMTFMVPLGLSAAAASMVGRAIGRSDMAAARRDAVAAIAVGLCFMTCAALVFAFLPDALASLFITDPATLALAASLIAIGAVFQMFDGIQGVATGVLRGTADTRVPMLIHLGGFWMVGAPAGLWLALRTPLGPRGVWWGYVAGLVTVAALQLWRVRWRLSRDIGRLRIEECAELERLGGEA